MNKSFLRLEGLVFYKKIGYQIKTAILMKFQIKDSFVYKLEIK